jgi:hypothetical protein
LRYSIFKCKFYSMSFKIHSCLRKTKIYRILRMMNMIIDEYMLLCWTIDIYHHQWSYIGISFGTRLEIKLTLRISNIEYSLFFMLALSERCPYIYRFTIETEGARSLDILKWDDCTFCIFFYQKVRYLSLYKQELARQIYSS